MSDDLVSLQDAASELGVHYSTAYRWVRSGELDARLVAGKYWLDESEIERARRRREAPAMPSAPSAARLRRQSAALQSALVEGDEQQLRRVGRSLIDDGASRLDLIEIGLVPALRHIGEQWSEGRIPIWVEHRATAMVERLLGELAPSPRGRRRGRVLVAAVSGDRHGLPAAMATTVLRESNWVVDHLGPDMPPAEIVGYARDNASDVVVITCTNPDVRSVAEETADELAAAGIPALVGRPGATLRTLLAEVGDAVKRDS